MGRVRSQVVLLLAAAGPGSRSAPATLNDWGVQLTVDLSSSMSIPAGSVPDHAGENYRVVLSRLHDVLRPQTYLEIGTRNGDTLGLARCDSIAIDPDFQLADPRIVSQLPVALFYQTTSDDFFRDYDPSAILGKNIDLVFLDGMHRCEFLLRDFFNVERYCSPQSIIAIHDCLPVELPMTSRNEFELPPIDPARLGWWTGDVWRTALLLKRERPDLKIISLDAAPTGLLLVTNLDPASTNLKDNYEKCVRRMHTFDLERISLSGLFEELEIESTSKLLSPEQIHSQLSFAQAGQPQLG